MSGERLLESTWKLLQPELLSNQELLDILKEKNVNTGNNEESQNRDQLIELFKRIAMPQSQRSRFSSKTSNINATKNNLPAAHAPRTCNTKIRSEETAKPVESLRTSFSEIKLKRNARQALGACSSAADDGNSTTSPSLSPQRKREKITWP